MEKDKPIIQIRDAKPEDAEAIASFIMNAMSEDCCAFFYGQDHTAEEFHRFMTSLVKVENSQYSYRNTIVAADKEKVVGALVSYDGAHLHELRTAFIDGMKSVFGKDFSQIDDETATGELYLDSLAVNPDYRKRGIASRLLLASAEKARRLGIPRVGLLVDQSNPSAEHLYRSVGFHYVEDAVWGGHKMRHLQKEVVLS